MEQTEEKIAIQLGRYWVVVNPNTGEMTSPPPVYKVVDPTSNSVTVNISGLTMGTTVGIFRNDDNSELFLERVEKLENDGTFNASVQIGEAELMHVRVMMRKKEYLHLSSNLSLSGSENVKLNVVQLKDFQL